MPNKNYISGRNFEYRVRDYLQKEGHLVFRSAGSHSIADLIVIPKNHSFSLNKIKPVLIQCKHGNSRFPTLDEFENLFRKYDIRFIVAGIERRKIVFYEFINGSFITCRKETGWKI
jgi:hypothetical protein